MNCPCCHAPLTEEQIRALWGAFCVSQRKHARGAHKVPTRCAKCSQLCDSARAAKAHCRTKEIS